MVEDDSSDDATTQAAEDTADSAANEATGRRKSHAIELFILGELMDGPHHGYLLRDILGRLLGPYRQISWAAIYPLIRKLHQEWRIAWVTDEELQHHGLVPGKRQPRYFRLTDTGRQRFYALMLTPAEHTADYRESFTIKLLYLHFLTPAQQQAIFADCHEYIEKEYRQRQRVFTRLSPSAQLPDEQRERVFRVIRFRLASLAAERAWVDGELAQLAEQINTNQEKSRDER